MAGSSRKSVAVVTMVRGDEDFLRIWLAYYGGLFGARALYVINHGDGPEVRDLAGQANVIALPGDHHPKFDARRWRLLNHFVQGLRIYYDVVLVGDVDEIVVMDPAFGTLHDGLRALPKVPVVTPFGLEVMHRPADEPTPLVAPVLAQRRHVRVSGLYSKPCIVQADVRLSRGGHYATCDRLTMPPGLYLLHLKHCDRDLYVRTLTARNAVAEATGVARPKDAMIGRHWFAQTRDDAGVFAQTDQAVVSHDFDMTAHRASMAQTWRPRSRSEFWEMAPIEDPTLYLLPERFAQVL